MSTSKETIVLGKLGGAYGIKGWLKVSSYTDDPEGIFDYSPWLIGRKGEWSSVNISQWRRHNKGLIVKLAEIEDRDQAEEWIGAEIAIRKDQLKTLDGDQFYWHDLIGCQVVSTKGYDFGIVTELMETGSNDVLSVKANPKDAFGKKERLIPYLDGQVIKRVDLDAKQIEVDWDPGF